jgi:beta-glucanase (GH16 family)
MNFFNVRRASSTLSLLRREIRLGPISLLKTFALCLGLVSAYAFASTDFNGDSVADILWQNTSGQVVVWYMGKSGYLNYASISTPVASGWTIKGTGDFNGDGVADILWQNTSGQVVVWYIGKSGYLSSASISTPVASSWTIKGTGDFNGDGVADILWQNTSGQVVVWYIGKSGYLNSASISTPVASSWTIKGTGDFNGDGVADILWQNTSGQVVVWYIGKSGYLSSSNISTPVASGWTIKGTGDFNGDGITDILWQNTSGQVVVWYIGKSGYLSSANISTPVASGWTIKGTGDFNGDGITDILWQNTSGQVAVWYIGKSGSATEANISTPVASSWKIVGSPRASGGFYNPDLTKLNIPSNVPLLKPNGTGDPLAGTGFIPNTGESFTLVSSLSDEFNEANLDTTKWWTRYIYNSGSLNYFNDECERYGESNNHVMGGGMLQLTAYPVAGTTCHAAANGLTFPLYKSGMIRSKTTFKYGYFEARVKMPQGKGVWPAFWINPENGWPPEIDIFEYVRSSVQTPNQLHAGVVASPTWPGPQGLKEIYSDPNEKDYYFNAPSPLSPSYFTDSFHVISCFWNQDNIVTMYVDGIPVQSWNYRWVNNSGVDPGYAHLLLNLAMGGSWPTANWTSGIDTTTQQLEIDYVRVYQKTGQEQLGTDNIGKNLCPATGC